MVLSFKTYLIVLPLVFLAAVVDSIAGGGGLISMPAYTLGGLDYNFTSGCNKFSAMFGTLVATVRYYKSGKLLVIPAVCAAVTALPGSWLGTRIAIWLGSGVMNGVMVFAIPVIGVLVLLGGRKEQKVKPITKTSYWLCALIGFVVGMYDGFFGPGTGTFLIIFFNWLVGMDLVTASATSKPVNLASNVASVITRIAAGNVIYSLALPAMACSIAGGMIGSRLALKKGAKIIRYVMLGVLVLLTVKLAVDWLGA